MWEILQIQKEKSLDTLKVIYKHSETQETMVLYRALYGECDLFVRPYGMFVEEVPEGKVNPTGQKYRFQEYEVKSIK